jgi:hypothetical protein
VVISTAVVGESPFLAKDFLILAPQICAQASISRITAKELVKEFQNQHKICTSTARLTENFLLYFASASVWSMVVGKKRPET